MLHPVSQVQFVSPGVQRMTVEEGDQNPTKEVIKF